MKLSGYTIDFIRKIISINMIRIYADILNVIGNKNS